MADDRNRTARILVFTVVFRSEHLARRPSLDVVTDQGRVRH